MAIGFLSNLVDDVRLALNDPAVTATYSDSEIIREAGKTTRRVCRDLSALSPRPLVIRYTISVTVNQQVYKMPVALGEAFQWGEYDTTRQEWLWKAQAKSRFGSWNDTIRLDGRRIVFDRKPTRAFTLTIDFVPSGDFLVHSGSRTFSTSLLSSTQFALLEPASSPTLGTIDDREGSYIGATLRVWPTASSSSDIVEVQERTVMDHTLDNTATGKKRLLTVDLAFDPALTQDGSQVYNYEIVPGWTEPLRQLIVLGTAMTLATYSTLPDKVRLLTEEYRYALRAEKLAEAFVNPHGLRWETDTDAAYLGGFWP